MCQRTKTTSAAAAAPTILSILCPTGKRSSHCSEAAAAAVAAVSISFGSRVTTQFEKGSRRKEGRKKGYERKGNSEFRPVGSPVGPNSKSRISRRRKSLQSVEEYSSQNCNQHVSGDNNSVRRSGRRAYELPVMTCPPPLLPLFPSSFRDQLPCAPISIGGVVRKRRCIHTAVYLVDGGRTRTGTVLTASPTTRRPT